MPYTPAPNVVSVNPTDASAITNAAYKMAGYGVSGASGGWSMTPNQTGRILLIATGVMLSGASASTCTLQLSFGTGAAPANAASVTGTQQGGQPAWISLTGNLQTPFSLTTVITGQTLGTALWFDVAQKSSASTLQLLQANLVAVEF